MKKVVSIAFAVCLLLLAGCASSQAQSPSSVLTAYFAAVKAQDVKTLQSLSDTSSMSSPSASALPSATSTQTPSSASSLESKEITNQIFSKMEITIEEPPTIIGDIATVKVKITTPDTKKIMQNCITSAFSSAMSNAFSNSSTSEKDTQDAITKQFKNELSQKDVALATTEMNVQLVKSNGQWKVKVTDNLTDAMTGGMFSYIKNFSNGLSNSGNN